MALLILFTRIKINIFNPDYYMVINTIETLNNRNIENINFKIRK
jgi:hypothetical protein